MDAYVLATRLRIPPQTHRTVARDRLTGALERGVPDHKLILISAPAGYGKTTLLALWAHESRFPVAWMSAGPEDDSLESFLRHLLVAWEQVQPDIRESQLGLLLGTMMPDVDAVLAAFLNVASDVPGHTVFVLDDYHLLADPSIHQALAFLLERLPAQIHFVLSCRDEPLLPLARHRARNELLEIGAEDLQFLDDEAGDFLNNLLGLGLADGDVSAVRDQLEGWITGLQLAGLSLQRHGAVAERLSISGRHRFIADYLTEDVLRHLPDDVQQFLFQTSILDHLSGPLCDAVAGRDDSQQMLELLERERLFLMPLDDNREWYRYHRIFADFLREGLNRRDTDDVAVLHRRASRWCLEHDLPEQAFEHVLAGNDLQLMIRIGERYLFQKLHHGEFRLLQKWLAEIPDHWYAAYPSFRLAEAGLFAYSGLLEDCIRCIDETEQLVARTDLDDPGPHMARVTALRCFVACFQNEVEQAEVFASQALGGLRDDDIAFRADIHHALGDTYRRNGRWEESRERYLKVLDFTRSPTFRALSAHVFGALADLELRQGRLKASAAYWDRALSMIQERENWGLFPLPVVGWVYLRMGEMLYEWNDLENAWQHVERGLDYAEPGGDARAMIAGYLIACRIRLTQGDIESAAEYLEQARALVEQTALSEWISRFERLQLELWLAQDRLRAAVHWSDEMLEDDASQERPESELSRLAMARVLIVKGDLGAIERALSLLKHLLNAAEAEGRTGIMIEALALQAIARWIQADQPAAMSSLEHALRLAEPEGYVRLLADLGLPMARLLQEARSRNVLPEYVSILLAACDHTVVPGPAGLLPEPLTRREQEILELLAAGLTNREIGERLFISAQTVKKHTGNILGKLGAHTRTEAASRARDLNLLT